MATSLHNLSDYDPHSVPDATGMRVGIVVSEWNEKITGALLEGACQTLMKHGVREENIIVKPVAVLENGVVHAQSPFLAASSWSMVQRDLSLQALWML